MLSSSHHVHPRRRTWLRASPRRLPPAPCSRSRPARRAPPSATQSTSYGYGGAVSSVDANASRIGLEVLRKGGNAADAAVATAAALGVTEPYSAGIGGGGYFVYFDAAHRRGHHDRRPRDGAGRHARTTRFIDPATGQARTGSRPSSSRRASSVGVPGTLATWEAALDRFGTASLARTLAAVDRARPRRGSSSTRRSAARRSTTRPGSRRSPTPPSCSCPAATPRRWARRSGTPTSPRRSSRIAARGTDAFYEGALADEIADVVQHPVRRPRLGAARVPPGR